MRHTQDLIRKIIEYNPLQTSYLKQILLFLTNEERIELDEYIRYCCSIGKGIDYLAKSYYQFLKDTLKEQLYFKRNHNYRYSKLSDVKENVYDQGDYMNMYMYSLAVSSFLWQQHVLIRRFYERVLPNDKKGKYLEIGPGHGYFFVKALKSTSYDYFYAIDISPISVKSTREILKFRFGNTFNNYDIITGDFLTYTFKNKFDAIIMGEVLEHVETPDLMLKKIYNIANPGAHIFITTCINAPMIDHIYLFKTLEEVNELVNNSGFFIVERICAPCLGESLESSLIKTLPINVAYQLSK